MCLFFTVPERAGIPDVSKSIYGKDFPLADASREGTFRRRLICRKDFGRTDAPAGEGLVHTAAQRERKVYRKMAKTMLEVRNLSVTYGKKKILDNLDFSVEEGQWLMIAGPNGAGKSTALSAIAGGTNYTGKVLFEGEDIRRMKPARLARCIGVLTQSHPVSYAFSVEEVAALGRYSYAPGFLSRNEGKKDAADAVDAALSLTGMADRRRQSVLTLSGGELQRTFLAQVFAQDPKLLLLDEPTNHLDLIYQKQIFGLILDWLKTPGRAVVSVIHDLSLARAYGTKALLMNLGRTAAYGTVGEALTPPILETVYGMDVYAWMREMLSQWK